MNQFIPHWRRRGLTVGLAAAALLTGSAVLAQTKVTKLVISFPPGGPVDFVARTLAEPLAKELGHTVIVENKPGGNGAIAADMVARAAPDGHTLWLTSVGAAAINPALYPRLSYKPREDLVPVSLLVNNVEVLVVQSKAPFQTGADLVRAAKAAKEPLTMASSGTGSVPHLAMEQLNDSAGIRLTHVPYKGAAPAITDVIAGHVTGFFGDIPGLVGHIEAGKLKPIGLAASKRHPRFPDVPTFAEMGMAGVDSDNWYGLFSSKGTPAAVAQQLSQAVRKVLYTPAVKARLEASGAEVAGSTPQELAQILEADTAKWGSLVRKKNITAD